MNFPSQFVARMMFSCRYRLFCTVLTVFVSACGGGAQTELGKSTTVSCATSLTQTGGGSTGAGLVFKIDPRVASGNNSLLPTSGLLDNYRSQVTLEHLGGRGVLEGSYIEVRNGLRCEDGFGASDPLNQFLYSQTDERFHEVMAYHFGDQFRAKLDQASSLLPSAPIIVDANCDVQDNAYYYRQSDSSGQIVDYVCLGYSPTHSKAHYADDATVVIHELQHATSGHFYSTAYDLNQLWYDEAGSLNEAISDFMALVFQVPSLPGSFDLKLFSRWALGSFMAPQLYHRGAHACPEYDATYPACGGYPLDPTNAATYGATPLTATTGFSAANKKITFVYPDGMGWPFANNFSSAAIRNAFETYSGQEEIHNAGTLVTGALWDIYVAMKANHSDNHEIAQSLVTKLVTQAISVLPMPISTVNRSPVTFVGFAQALVARASSITGISPADQTAISAILTQRGLLGGPTLGANWGEVGTGNSPTTPKIRIVDSRITLAYWLGKMGFSSTSVVNSNIVNNRLDPGEVAAIWFDIKNIDTITAASLLIDVTSPDADITFMNGNYNFGYISSSRAQIRYGKINGTAIVAALNDGTAAQNTGATNSYFGTNTSYDDTFYTALWIKARSTAAHGKTVNLQVTVTPVNGPQRVLTFPVVIN